MNALLSAVVSSSMEQTMPGTPVRKRKAAQLQVRVPRVSDARPILFLFAASCVHAACGNVACMLLLAAMWLAAMLVAGACWVSRATALDLKRLKVRRV